MMTERDQLLRAVLENPAEDTPRLVLADWLDEFGGVRGRARAEFIRVQCELARTPRCLIAKGELLTTEAGTGELVPYSPNRPERPPVGIANKETLNPRHVALSARETALLKTWGMGWLPKSMRPSQSLPLYVGSGGTVPITAEMGFGGYVRFERGFVAYAGCELVVVTDGSVAHDAERFGKSLAALFRHNPLTGFTVSFAGTTINLHAEIGPQEPNACVTVPHWRLMWDMQTYELLPFDATETPVGCPARDALTHSIAPWLTRAIRRPAELAAEQYAAEASDLVLDEVLRDEWTDLDDTGEDSDY